ncbi:MAG: YggS family pyridoxal phosphate-dependent enzyme [Paludibacteraceae bacterium]|nr:YggS family pyridoxal phosphate-dependent enzyme [Paludibacteraceae bacterium]
MSVKSQLERVRVTLPEGVTLVAVSKTHPVEAIAEAYEAGQRIFGESRPQELRAKYEALPRDIEWHMIGHLQTNKVKYIAPFVTLIHSVDSERLAEAIQVQAAKCGRTIDVLLEIHVAAEESKSGWAIDDLRTAVASGLFERLPNVRVRGVMGIATNTDDMERVSADFVQLRIYKEELAPYFGEQFDTLSMGMSDDYPTAIAAGSTMVRIGSTIFGARGYSK